MRKVLVGMVAGFMVSSALMAADMVDGSILVGDTSIIKSESLNKLNLVDCDFDMSRVVSKIEQQSIYQDKKSKDSITYEVTKFNYEVAEDEDNGVFNHEIEIATKVEYKDFMGKVISKEGTIKVLKTEEDSMVDSYAIRQLMFQTLAKETREIKEALL